MCDFFWQRMEDDQGDLADIVRAGGHGLPATGDFPVASWQLPGDSMSVPQLSSADGAPDDFGDPFASFQDPLLGELRAVEFFDAADAMPGGSDGGQVVAGKCLIGEEMQKPCCGGGGGIFSRMLQISPDAAKAMRAIRPSPVVMAAGEMVRVGGGAEHVARMQISSPRTLGIKRRKSQPKKVICIPAPAPAAGSNRPGGDVVPSDLWAWRKYGQKPIKGSPYPRGYYRCSSSKGCSARKQVERSRTDPNMLVITYTSEHNHPWPTQRNALAGSTKSHASKNNNNSSKIFHKSPGSVKEEAREEAMTTSSGIISPLVKEEEIGELIDHKAVDAAEESGEFNSQVFDHQSYKPMIPDSNQSDDFFADLAELEADPMSLIFSKEFMEERKGEKACLDAFNVFDWGSSSFGEAKKGL